MYANLCLGLLIECWGGEGTQSPAELSACLPRHVSTSTLHVVYIVCRNLLSFRVYKRYEPHHSWIWATGLNPTSVGFSRTRISWPFLKDQRENTYLVDHVVKLIAVSWKKIRNVYINEWTFLCFSNICLME